MKSCFFSCKLRPLTGSGFFQVAEIPRSVEQSFSDLVFLQVAEVGTLGWELTAGNPSFPVEREPMQVPVHHLQSTI